MEMRVTEATSSCGALAMRRGTGRGVAAPLNLRTRRSRTRISFSRDNNKRVVVFTTPANYASRLSRLLQLRGGFKPLWCPTVVVEPTIETKSFIRPYLNSKANANANANAAEALVDFSAIAFTSRTGIWAFHEILEEEHDYPPPLPQTGDTFTIAALGKDAELLYTSNFVSKLCQNPDRIRILVPPVATPTSLAESLGRPGGLGGRRRMVLCPVPLVVGLDEPPVIPNFLHSLASRGWIPIKVSAYETRWAGPTCAKAFLQTQADAIAFTSTGEVEGLLKSLRELGFDWEMVKKRWPRLVVAAHGPVTAAGAERLGVTVDVVSSSFASFDGVVQALISRFQTSGLDYHDA